MPEISDEPDSPEVQELKKRYHRLLHQLQSGVALKLEIDPSDCKPKHLRVGINASMSENAALVQLLMDKGFITPEEYYTALCNSMESEVESYKKWLSERLGAPIELA